MPSDQDLISERDFENVWGVYLTPSGDLFQFDEVREQPENCVWTVVDSGDDTDGNWYALPGFHVVNKLGYVMTRKPWSDSTPDAIYFLDDFEDE
jgi:hypothetical protein